MKWLQPLTSVYLAGVGIRMRVVAATPLCEAGGRSTCSAGSQSIRRGRLQERPPHFMVLHMNTTSAAAPHVHCKVEQSPCGHAARDAVGKQGTIFETTYRYILWLPPASCMLEWPSGMHAHW